MTAGGAQGSDALALGHAWWQGYRAAWEDALSGMRIPTDDSPYAEPKVPAVLHANVVRLSDRRRAR